MAKKNTHVVPYGDRWAVRREKASRVSVITRTQADAIEESRRLAKKSKGESIIHRKDGTIRDKDSYGNDPNPPKDQRH